MSLLGQDEEESETCVWLFQTFWIRQSWPELIDWTSVVVNFDLCFDRCLPVSDMVFRTETYCINTFITSQNINDLIFNEAKVFKGVYVNMLSALKILEMCVFSILNSYWSIYYCCWLSFLWLDENVSCAAGVWEAKADVPKEFSFLLCQLRGCGHPWLQQLNDLESQTTTFKHLKILSGVTRCFLCLLYLTK